MTQSLDLTDIQGNVTRAYGRYSFPFARYFFLHIDDAAHGRNFVNAIRKHITSAKRWTDETKPKATMNIGFTWAGLAALKLPTRTLRSMPSEFIDGMKSRSFLLGDNPDVWDKIWKENRNLGLQPSPTDVHIWVSINAQARGPFSDQPHEQLEKTTQILRDLCKKSAKGKVNIIPHNGQSGEDEFQSANAVFDTLPGGKKIVTPKEHFGLTDGISDPVFKGQYDYKSQEDALPGRGKWMDKKKGWQPLETGEFILGHVDESQGLPVVAEPPNLIMNGTFMAFRKLHENIATYRKVIKTEAKTYAKVMGVDMEEAEITLEAKMVGRWPNGVPLSKIPTFDAWRQFCKEEGFLVEDKDNFDAVLQSHINRGKYIKSEAASNFKYGDDMEGTKCPVGSHIRRVNTRDYLDPLNKPDSKNPDSRSALNRRRRLLRRGLPYGPTTLGQGDDNTEQGVAMMLLCASLFRQFEFVQQQWIQYSLDFKAGNNTCPLLGNHKHFKRHIIEGDPESGKPLYVMSKLKTFVEDRGGDYFFIPSLNALRMIGMGIVDPTT